MDSDRLAMLRRAQSIAARGIELFPMDKHSYMAYGDVGLAIAERSQDTAVLDDAIIRMGEAVDTIMDPHSSKDCRGWRGKGVVFLVDKDPWVASSIVGEVLGRRRLPKVLRNENSAMVW